MVDNLKEKTISGVLWSAIERFSLQGVQFIINIIMARLLLPSDYGMIGMLAIFLQISQAFINCGFNNALVQRKDRTDIDFSTVFYFNVIIAILFYLILFISAPLIAKFYSLPSLISVIRMLGLNLIISAFSSIHKTILTIRIDFKTQSKVSLIAASVSGCMGIVMAYAGWGVWALVSQSLMNAFLTTLLFHYFFRWKPLRGFSKQSFHNLFSFGSKLMIAGIMNTLYRNLYMIVIGRRFSATDLGYYTRAEQFVYFPSSNLTTIISRVTYPILSSIQDDDNRLIEAYRKYIQLASFIIFPLMVGLAVLADPIVKLLLTDKWNGVIVLLQILCFDWMFDHLSYINLNLLWVKGRSDLSLRIEIVKKIIAVFILFASIPLGIEGMCWGRVLYSVMAIYINTYYTKRIIGLDFIRQMKDILPYLFVSGMMGAIVSISVLCLSSVSGQIFCGVLIGAVFYLSVAFFFRLSAFNHLLSIIKW